MKFLKSLTYTLIIAFSSLALADLVVYTDRPMEWFQAAVDEFEAETGVNVKAIDVAPSEVVEKLSREGRRTRADLIFTKDIVQMSAIVERRLTQPLPEFDNFENIPESMRGPNKEFAALMYRVRAAVYNPEELSSEDLVTYEEFAQPMWGDQLCLRDLTNDYNTSLIAFLIAQHGPAKAEEIVSGWIFNLANTDKPIQQKDSGVIDLVLNGECGVGIVNHYYLARKIDKARSQGSEYDVSFAFLNQGDEQGGVHTNGVSVLMSAFSKKQDLVQTFLNKVYQAENLKASAAPDFQYPAIKGFVPAGLLQEFGSQAEGNFELSPINWLEVGSQRDLATTIVEGL